MTQAQHAQQAAELAKAEGHPPHVLVGALLHDIGDLNGLALDGGGVMMMRWPPHVLIDAFLHDIGDLDGHASDGCGDCNDEDIGAKAEGHNNGLELMKYPHLC